MTFRSKYRAKRTNGFASKREAKRAQELVLLERAGEISDLRYQVEYELIPAHNGERPCKYRADFTYRDKFGNEVVEDCKGFRTPEYKIKRKLMNFRHNIKILET